MANRGFNEQGCLEEGIRTLFVAIPLGTSGAVATTGVGGKGVASVVKTATKVGRYTVTLQDRYISFVGGRVTFIGTADAAPGGATGGYFRNNSLGTSTKTIDVQLSLGGVDTEADTNTTVLVELKLKDSTV